MSVDGIIAAKYPSADFELKARFARDLWGGGQCNDSARFGERAEGAATAGDEEQDGAQHEREAMPEDTGTAGDKSWRVVHDAATMLFFQRLIDSFFQRLAAGEISQRHHFGKLNSQV